jgi:hypothetical protein
MSEYTIDEALRYRTNVLEAAEAIDAAVATGQETIASLRAKASALATMIDEIPSLPVHQLADRVANLSEDALHLVNGEVEEMVAHGTRLARLSYTLQGHMPCEQGVRDFAGDHDGCHEECTPDEDVLLTYGHDRWTRTEARLVSFDDLADWLSRLVDEGRVTDLIDTAISELRDERFDVGEMF